MGEKDLKIMVGDNLTMSGDVKFTVVSTIQPTPNEKPIVKRFSISSSSEDIVTGTFRGLEEAGYIVEPKTVDLFMRTVEDMKDLGVGFKLSGNLALEGGGGSFEKAPKKQTEKYIEKHVKISFELKKEG
jgi:hypothetical protein